MCVRSCTIHRRPMSTLPMFDSIRARGCTTVSDWMVMEWLPCRMALSEMVRDDEKFTGGFGPLRSMAGRMECRLLDMLSEKCTDPQGLPSEICLLSLS